MIYVDDEILNLYNENSREISMIVQGNIFSFTNEDLISLSITETLNSSQNLALGNVSSRMLQFKCCYPKDKEASWNETREFDVYMQLTKNGFAKAGTYLGRFYRAESSSKDDYKTIDVTAYDYLYSVIKRSGDIYHRLEFKLRDDPTTAKDIITDALGLHAKPVVSDASTVQITKNRVAEICDYDSTGSIIETEQSYGVTKNNLIFIPPYVEKILLKIHSKYNFTSPLTSPLKVCFFTDFYGNTLSSETNAYKEYTGYTVETEDGGYVLSQEISVAGDSENYYPFYMGFAILRSNAYGAKDTYEIELTFPEHTPLTETLEIASSDDVNLSPAKVASYMSGTLGANLSVNYYIKDLVFTKKDIKLSPYRETGFEITPDITYQNGFQKKFKEPISIDYVATGSNDNLVTAGEGDYGMNFENPYITKQSVAEDILKRYSNLVLMPGKIKYRGNPFVQAGDIVIVKDNDGSKYNFIVCKNELRYSGGLSCTLTFDLSNDRTSSYVSTPNTVSVSNRISEFSKIIEDMKSFKTLWEGQARMLETTTITLSEPLSNQMRGIILEWQLAADNTSAPYGDSSFQFVAKNFKGDCVFDSGTVVFTTNCRKRIVVDDQTITGTEYNGQTGTINGVTYDNRRMVLVAVYGW